MHILLLILKIIGIILLVLLGLILFLALLLVFVPFYYRAEGQYYEAKPYVMARVRYLFPLLQVRIQYKDGEAEGKVKLFGFTIYDFFAPEDDKKKTEENTSDDTVEADKSSLDDLHKEDAENDISTEGTSAEVALTEDIPVSEEEEEEKLTLGQKIQRFTETIKNKISEFLKKCKELKEKGIRLKEKADETAQKIKHYYSVWQEDYTQRAFQKAKKSLYKLWKSIRPRKGRVNLHFGTGDPASTGQMCGYFGMLYPFLGKYVMIEPDFENKIYEGDFYFKGHLTLFAFLKVVWIVLFDKDIKKLRKILMK